MPGARILPLKASGASPLRPSVLVLSATMPVRRDSVRAGGCQALRQHQGPILWSSALPHDDRAVIENPDPLTRSCKPLTDPYARSIQKLANKRCSPSRKPRMRTTSSGSGTTGKRRDGRGLPDLPKPWRQIQAQHLAAEEQQRPPMPDDAWRPKPALVRRRDRNASTSLLPKVAGDVHRGNGMKARTQWT